ncbi:hypothetical protein [Streptomyces gibsoniae]|uniref:Uncharacterized protein n=1 Tax=Streptomyces gibsoniae TaxID=3075529 RepID=A0ABU2U3D7_9ACTN|nr:hypothetical protein [Streptomyces sp. DSM 41699]MDT0467620.1 hypothetical protein [Streptomyces sp. DSM 41699]
MKTTDTTVCVYDGSPAIELAVADNGSSFGLCVDCGPAHAKGVAVEKALAKIEGYKSGADANVTELWNIIAGAIKRCGDPGAVMDQVLDLIERHRLGRVFL